jgi:hypothetical protein
MIGCIRKCGKVADTRGLCPCHYTQARNRVKAGKVTWAGLEAAGESLPPRPAKGFRRYPPGSAKR